MGVGSNTGVVAEFGSRSTAAAAWLRLLPALCPVQISGRAAGNSGTPLWTLVARAVLARTGQPIDGLLAGNGSGCAAEPGLWPDHFLAHPAGPRSHRHRRTSSSRFVCCGGRAAAICSAVAAAVGDRSQSVVGPEALEPGPGRLLLG